MQALPGFLCPGTVSKAARTARRSTRVQLRPGRAQIFIASSSSVFRESESTMSHAQRSAPPRRK